MAIHLIKDKQQWQLVLLRLAHYGIGLRLDALERIDYHKCSIQYLQATANLGGKVDVTGGVNELQAMIAPRAMRDGSRDGDAAFALFTVPIHYRSAYINSTHA